MVFALTQNWWALVIRGIAASVFGVIALAWPGIAIAVLVLLFGAYTMVDGIFAIAAALHPSDETRLWALLLEGMFGILVGLLAVVVPGITALFLLYLIAFWGLVTGILKITSAIRLRQLIENESLMVLSGIAPIAFGVLLVLFPGAGAVALAWLIGAYAVVSGILLAALGIRLRRHASFPILQG